MDKVQDISLNESHASEGIPPTTTSVRLPAALPKFTPGSNGPKRIIKKITYIDPLKIKQLGIEQKIAEAISKLKEKTLASVQNNLPGDGTKNESRAGCKLKVFLYSNSPKHSKKDQLTTSSSKVSINNKKASFNLDGNDKNSTSQQSQTSANVKLLLSRKILQKQNKASKENSDGNPASASTSNGTPNKSKTIENEAPSSSKEPTKIVKSIKKVKEKLSTNFASRNKESKRTVKSASTNIKDVAQTETKRKRGRPRKNPTNIESNVDMDQLTTIKYLDTIEISSEKPKGAELLKPTSEFCGFSTPELSSEEKNLTRLSELIDDKDEKVNSVETSKIPSFSNLRTYLKLKKVQNEGSENSSDSIDTVSKKEEILLTTAAKNVTTKKLPKKKPVPISVLKVTKKKSAKSAIVDDLKSKTGIDLFLSSTGLQNKNVLSEENTDKEEGKNQQSSLSAAKKPRTVVLKVLNRDPQSGKVEVELIDPLIKVEKVQAVVSDSKQDVKDESVKSADVVPENKGMDGNEVSKDHGIDSECSDNYDAPVSPRPPSISSEDMPSPKITQLSHHISPTKSPQQQISDSPINRSIKAVQNVTRKLSFSEPSMSNHLELATSPDKLSTENVTPSKDTIKAKKVTFGKSSFDKETALEVVLPKESVNMTSPQSDKALLSPVFNICKQMSEKFSSNSQSKQRVVIMEDTKKKRNIVVMGIRKDVKVCPTKDSIVVQNNSDGENNQSALIVNQETAKNTTRNRTTSLKSYTRAKKVVRSNSTPHKIVSTAITPSKESQKLSNKPTIPKKALKGNLSVKAKSPLLQSPKGHTSTSSSNKTGKSEPSSSKSPKTKYKFNFDYLLKKKRPKSTAFDPADTSLVSLNSEMIDLPDDDIEQELNEYLEAPNPEDAVDFLLSFGQGSISQVSDKSLSSDIESLSSDCESVTFDNLDYLFENSLPIKKEMEDSGTLGKVEVNVKQESITLSPTKNATLQEQSTSEVLCETTLNGDDIDASSDEQSPEYELLTIEPVPELKNEVDEELTEDHFEIEILDGEVQETEEETSRPIVIEHKILSEQEKISLFGIGTEKRDSLRSAQVQNEETHLHQTLIMGEDLPTQEEIELMTTLESPQSYSIVLGEVSPSNKLPGEDVEDYLIDESEVYLLQDDDSTEDPPNECHMLGKVFRLNENNEIEVIHNVGLSAISKAGNRRKSDCKSSEEVFDLVDGSEVERKNSEQHQSEDSGQLNDKEPNESSCQSNLDSIKNISTESDGIALVKESSNLTYEKRNKEKLLSNKRGPRKKFKPAPNLRGNVKQKRKETASKVKSAPQNETLAANKQGEIKSLDEENDENSGEVLLTITGKTLILPKESIKVKQEVQKCSPSEFTSDQNEPDDTNLTDKAPLEDENLLEILPIAPVKRKRGRPPKNRSLSIAQEWQTISDKVYVEVNKNRRKSLMFPISCPELIKSPVNTPKIAEKIGNRRKTVNQSEQILDIRPTTAKQQQLSSISTPQQICEDKKQSKNKHRKSSLKGGVDPDSMKKDNLDESRSENEVRINDTGSEKHSFVDQDFTMNSSEFRNHRTSERDSILDGSSRSLVSSNEYDNNERIKVMSNVQDCNNLPAVIKDLNVNISILEKVHYIRDDTMNEGIQTDELNVKSPEKGTDDQMSGKDQLKSVVPKLKKELVSEVEEVKPIISTTTTPSSTTIPTPKVKGKVGRPRKVDIEQKLKGESETLLLKPEKVDEDEKVLNKRKRGPRFKIDRLRDDIDVAKLTENSLLENTCSEQSINSPCEQQNLTEHAKKRGRPRKSTNIYLRENISPLPAKRLKIETKTVFDSPESEQMELCNSTTNKMDVPRKRGRPRKSEMTTIPVPSTAESPNIIGAIEVTRSGRKVKLTEKSRGSGLFGELLSKRKYIKKEVAIDPLKYESVEESDRVSDMDFDTDRGDDIEHTPEVVTKSNRGRNEIKIKRKGNDNMIDNDEVGSMADDEDASDDETPISQVLLKLKRGAVKDNVQESENVAESITKVCLKPNDTSNINSKCVEYENIADISTCNYKQLIGHGNIEESGRNCQNSTPKDNLTLKRIKNDTNEPESVSKIYLKPKNKEEEILADKIFKEKDQVHDVDNARNDLETSSNIDLRPTLDNETKIDLKPISKIYLKQKPKHIDITRNEIVKESSRVTAINNECTSEDDSVHIAKVDLKMQLKHFENSDMDVKEKSKSVSKVNLNLKPKNNTKNVSDDLISHRNIEKNSDNGVTVVPECSSEINFEVKLEHNTNIGSLAHANFEENIRATDKKTEYTSREKVELELKPSHDLNKLKTKENTEEMENDMDIDDYTTNESENISEVNLVEHPKSDDFLKSDKVETVPVTTLRDSISNKSDKKTYKRIRIISSDSESEKNRLSTIASESKSEVIVQDTPKDVKKRGRKKIKTEESQPNVKLDESTTTTTKSSPAFTPEKKVRKRKYDTILRIHPKLLLVSKRKDLYIEDEQELVPLTSGEIRCGFCKAATKKSAWSNHIQSHYYVGWKEGEPSIDITDYRVVLSAMNQSMKIYGVKIFECKLCGLSLKSAAGLLYHIESCQATEQEREQMRYVCICGKTLSSQLNTLVHMKVCPKEKKVEENQNETFERLENNESSMPLKKRKAVLKAEKLLKESLAEDIDSVVDDLVKPYTEKTSVVMIKWKARIKRNCEGKCISPNCSFKSFEIPNLVAHHKICDKIIKSGYICTRCKFVAVDKMEVVQHARERHAAKNFEASASEAEVGEESSESDGSSGVDENEVPQSKSRRKDLRKPAPSTIKTSEKWRKIFNAHSGNNFINEAKQWTKKFRNYNYSDQPLFTYAIPIVTPLDSVYYSDYNPNNSYSMKFSYTCKNKINKHFGGSTKPEIWNEMEVFESEILFDDIITFVGGPVSSLAWIPTNSYETLTQYLAVTYKNNMNQFVHQINPEKQKICMLIYEIGTYDSIKEKTPPKILYGVPFDSGPVFDIKFLPSGGYAPELNRLGLVAVSTAETNVNIYSLPLKAPYNCDRTINFPLLVIKPTIVLSLDLLKRDLKYSLLLDAQCMTMTWSKFKGHTQIAGGFINGFVAIWDISEDDNLNCVENGSVRRYVPTNYFHTSNNRITCIDFHYDANGPRWLIVSNEVRSVNIFDLRDSSFPTIVSCDQMRANLYSVEWPFYWENPILPLSDELLKGVASVSTFSPMTFFYRTRAAIRLGSGVLSLSFNEWQNSCVIGCVNGDLAVFRLYEWRHDVSSKLCFDDKYLSYTDMIQLDGADILDKIKSTDGDNKEYVDLFDSDYKHKYGLIINHMQKCQMESGDLARDREPAFNLNQYVKINHVASNPNEYGHEFYAAGYENGLVRIFLFNADEQQNTRKKKSKSYRLAV